MNRKQIARILIFALVLVAALAIFGVVLQVQEAQAIRQSLGR